VYSFSILHFPLFPLAPLFTIHYSLLIIHSLWYYHDGLFIQADVHGRAWGQVSAVSGGLVTPVVVIFQAKDRNRGIELAADIYFCFFLDG
jgi:hypothetical protein